MNEVAGFIFMMFCMLISALYAIAGSDKYAVAFAGLALATIVLV